MSYKGPMAPQHFHTEFGICRHDSLNAKCLNINASSINSCSLGWQLISSNKASIHLAFESLSRHTACYSIIRTRGIVWCEHCSQPRICSLWSSLFSHNESSDKLPQLKESSPETHRPGPGLRRESFVLLCCKTLHISRCPRMKFICAFEWTTDILARL